MPYKGCVSKDFVVGVTANLGQPRGEKPRLYRNPPTSVVRLFRETIFSPVLALFNLPKPGKVVHAADPGFWEGLWNSLRPIANTSAEWLT